MATGAPAVPLEHGEPEPLLGVEGAGVPVQERVVARLVRDLRRPVEHDGQPPVQGEVVLHDREAVHHRARVPPRRIERGPDQRRVGGVEAEAREPGERAQHAVGGVHELLAERPEREELAAELGEAPPRARHLDAIVRRPDFLGRQASVGEGDLDRCRHAVGHAQDPGGWVGRSRGVHAVEDVVRAAVPEVPEVEDRVDAEGRVPACDLAIVAERAAENRPAAVHGAGEVQADEVPLEHALGADHIIDGDGEVGGRQGAARRHCLEDSVGARVDRVDGAVVRARVEVARGAGLHAVAARLCLPEERLAQLDCSVPVHHEGTEVGRQGNGHPPECLQPREGGSGRPEQRGGNHEGPGGPQEPGRA